ncbi:hypothetical protein GCM10022246_00990 [Pedobacter ginsengiterrae]|uniref:Uncharacterized protein n=1 Tax=Pedobacter ginsengiterrae TaxID=871696 RepID=A0ABP7NMJ3_9SPHI
MKKLIFLSVLFFSLSFQVSLAQEKVIKEMLTRINYGVASSPALELLPGKVSEVTHLTSAHDLYANFGTFISGKRLKSDLAVDARPFAFASGSLGDYQNNYFKRLLWRTSFSLGSSPGSDHAQDVFLAAGLRFTLIDKADPRTNRAYIDELRNAYLKALGKVQPRFGETAADFQKRLDAAAADSTVVAVRESFTDRFWNASRLDLGFGASALAANGFLKKDSLFKDRVGLWSAYSTKLWKQGQLVVSAQTAMVSHKSDTTERSRNVIGARARYFNKRGFAISGEYAHIFSNYRQKSFNENWGHLALVAEFKIPKLGGWAGFAYGGDMPHRSENGAKFAFRYAVYTDQLIKK